MADFVFGLMLGVVIATFVIVYAVSRISHRVLDDMERRIELLAQEQELKEAGDG